MNLSDLKALCDAATPGPMTVEGDGRQVFCDQGIIVDCGTQWADDDDENGQEADYSRGKRNAAYISALSPERVLAMIACIEAADAYIATTNGDNEDWHEHKQAYDAARAAIEEEMK